jgi:hypothetical protein
MQDLYNNLTYVWGAQGTVTSTGSPSQLSSGGIDLAGFAACDLVGILGDIDELGGSPVGSASVSLQVEHSDDDVTYTPVVLADVIGPTSVGATGGCVSTTTDQTTLKVGYRMNKRYVKASLVATALTNGGPGAVMAIKGHARSNGGEAV